MTLLKKFDMPINGNLGQKMPVVVNASAVRWVRGTKPVELGGTFIGLLGSDDDRPAFIPVNATAEQVIRSLNLQAVSVESYDLGGRTDFDGVEYFVVPTTIRMVRPGTVDEGHWVIQFKDGSELTVKRPDNLFALVASD